MGDNLVPNRQKLYATEGLEKGALTIAYDLEDKQPNEVTSVELASTSKQPRPARWQNCASSRPCNRNNFGISVSHATRRADDQGISSQKLALTCFFSWGHCKRAQYHASISTRALENSARIRQLGNLGIDIPAASDTVLPSCCYGISVNY